MGVLHCPHWPVVAAGAATGDAVAVLHANRVIAHSLAAAADGVAVGQRRRQAQARCPHLRLELDDPARDAREFDAVVAAVAELVPRVEILEPGTLAFLARGPARYFGGEPAMAERLAAVARQAVGASMGAVPGMAIGVADGRFAATVAARRATLDARVTAVVPVGGSARFLAPLPVDALTEVAGIEDDLVGLFARLGIRCLGALAALPDADVLARFGSAGVFAHRLAAGGDDRPARTAVPPRQLVAERVFDQPVITTEPLVFVARQLAEQLTGALAASGLVCTRLVVRAETEHGERSERIWYRPTGLGLGAMVERVRWQLDAWSQHDTLTAGVVLLRLEPDEVRIDHGLQLGLWGGRTQADEWAARAVARLGAIAGDQQVLVPAWRGGRQPADAYRWVPAANADLTEPAERLARSPGPWPGQLPIPSPSTVHQPARQVEVRDRAGAAVRVSGRGVVSAAPHEVAIDGVVEVITAWNGPWPLEERWWDRPRARRAARFQLLTASGRLLLASLERQLWWLDAEYC
jgi:protein ImuB